MEQQVIEANRELFDQDQLELISGGDSFQEYTLPSLDLSSLLEDQPGDTFDEAYLETASGNQYAIFRSPTPSSNSHDSDLVIVNKAKNLDNLEETGQVTGRYISKEVAERTKITVGSQLYFGTGRTTPVTNITAINRRPATHKEPIEIENGQLASAREKFWFDFKEDGAKNPNLYSASNNDQLLVQKLLYPDQGPLALYSKLVGDSPTIEQQPWDPNLQSTAQKGMEYLFHVALYPFQIEGVGFEKARIALEWLENDSVGQEKRDEIANQGGKLRYQNSGDIEDLEYTGKFLHFGVNYSYENAPDLLPNMVRVYVTPKMEYVGYVAAETIARAAEEGFRPHGKLFDESSNNNPISERTDRLIFFTRTESHLRLILGKLNQIHQEHPEMFEPSPPLLTEKIFIPGVGIAEEPKQVNGVNMSFTTSREDLIHEAWMETMAQFTGTDSGSTVRVVGVTGLTHLLDSRLLRIRDDVATSPGKHAALVNAFRVNVRKMSPKHGVSPDNFARNL